jgi:hypothetical protein
MASVNFEGKVSMAASQIHGFRKLTAVAAIGLALLFSGAFSSAAFGQAVAEAAGATSVSGGVGSSMKAISLPTLPANAASSSPHLTASTGPAPEETNRRVLESHAGKEAGKVLLRATPVEAQIWVNGQIVGKTPLLLVLAPGKYEIEMRGARGQTGKRTVDLLPRETREMAVKLEPLYPARVKVTR